MHKYLLIILTVILPFSFLLGQDETLSPKLANDYFDAGKYQEAKVIYKALLDKYSRNPQYNYYYGVTLCLTKEDYSEAIRRLRFSAMSGISKDVNYYLGRALQMTYEFTEAKKCYIQFKKTATLGDVRVQNSTKFIQECDYGILNSTKYYSLTITDKDTVNKKKIISLYYPSKESGNILKNSDFFQSGVDPNGIMYMTERQDEAYFSLFSTGTRGQDLYKMVKLLDGWSDNDALPSSINSAFDEGYPYLASNGTTLYFASNKPGGFGGYDIYKTEYNIATKSYSDPINMGIPFNSPDDDLLFVTDDINSVAWFASNRETTGDIVTVYKLNWTNTTQKSNVADVRDIIKAARLDVSINALKEAQRNGNFTYQSEQAKSRTAPKFKFAVDDTLTYTNFEQFKSPEALQYYKKGYDILQKRDSLNNKMREKRAFFQMSDDDSVKDKLVLEILKMEKELYGYDDIIEESNFVARRLETEKIREMVGSGNYKSAKISTPNTYNLSSGDVTLNPEKYQFYSEDAFEKRSQKFATMYQNIFDDSDIDKLKQADSLYVWGSILTLEASSLLDKSAHSTQANELKFKSSSTEPANQANSTEMLIEESKKLKEASLRFLLSSLDEKFGIYSLKLGEILPQISADRGQHYSDEEAKANSYYREASGLYSSNDALEFSQIEKVIGLKKMAVDTQDKMLFDYSSASKQGWTLTPSSAAATPTQRAVPPVVTPTVIATDIKVLPKVNPEKPTPQPTPNNIDGLVYKIQIGVFRNAPSETLLSGLHDVTYEQVEGKDVVKYYAGQYSTSDEAISDIQSVKDAGFPGAYLVAFYEGKQIDLNKAKTLEGK